MAIFNPFQACAHNELLGNTISFFPISAFYPFTFLGEYCSLLSYLCKRTTWKPVSWSIPQCFCPLRLLQIRGYSLFYLETEGKCVPCWSSWQSSCWCQGGQVFIQRFGISFTGEVSTWTALITFLFCQCQSIHPLYVQTGEEPRWCHVTLPSRSISKEF